MRTSILLPGTLAAFGLGTAAQAVNLVSNGSFDVDTIDTKMSFFGHVEGWSGGANLTFLAPPGQRR